jgi:hypothetical protein
MPRDVSLYDFVDRTHGHQAALDGQGLRGTCRREGVTGDMSGPKRVHPELCAVTVAKRFERRLVRIEEITTIGVGLPGAIDPISQVLLQGSVPFFKGIEFVR